MDELVRKQDVIDAVHYYIESGYKCDIFQELKNLPSAEPERIAKVEIVEKPNVYKCSECGQYFHSTAWGSPVEYCSRCGAKLDWSGNEFCKYK